MRKKRDKFRIVSRISSDGHRWWWMQLEEKDGWRYWTPLCKSLGQPMTQVMSIARMAWWYWSAGLLLEGKSTVVRESDSAVEQYNGEIWQTLEVR